MADYTITQLDISQKGLSKLPDDIDKYINIKELICNYNKITNLDNLPTSLKELYCDNNPLTYDFKPSLRKIKNYNSTRKL